MKHFNEILSTLGATNIECLDDTPEWSFWRTTYRTPVANVNGSYLYLKHKCPLKEATPENLAKWSTLSKNEGYIAIVTPRSPLTDNIPNTKKAFGSSAIYTSKQLIMENFLKDFHAKPIQPQDYFVDPSLELETGETIQKATAFLSDWISGATNKSLKNTSVAVLVADGGVGKTTVSRVLCCDLNKKDPNTIPLLIESDQWRNLLQTTMTMDMVWDLAVSRRFEHAGRLLANGTALRVLVREGLFAVIFDGFDELCVAPGSQLKPCDVINELLQMVTPEDEVRQARIILTTRQTYWNSVADELDLSKLEVFRLKGFDNEQRKRYFSVRLKAQEERDLAFRISKQIGGGIYDSIPKEDANEDRPSGVPFILDLIAQYVYGNKDVDLNPYIADPLESLLIDVCKRENRRQTLGIDPLKQFEVFEELFREFQNMFTVEDLKLFLECIADVSDISIVQRFTNHVFLVRQAGDLFGPKYEVLRVYFIARFLAHGLGDPTKLKSRNVIARLLAENRTGKTQVIDWLKDQLKRFPEEQRIAAIHHAIDIINDKENRDVWKSSSVGLYHLVTKLMTEQNKSGRMQQLASFMKASRQNSDDIFFTKVAFSGIIRALDLSEVTFTNCFFDNVEFKNCVFSKNTNFRGCTFEGTLEFSSCENIKDILVCDAILSREAEYSLDSVKKTGVKVETRITFAEDALMRALRKFKGDFGFESIQFRHRSSGFKAGNPYNEKIWESLEHFHIIEYHRISNVEGGGINLTSDKEVRRETAFFYDNGVLGRTLQRVVDELIN